MPGATRTIAAVHGEKELNAYALKQHVPDSELWKFLKDSVPERRRQVDEVRARFLEMKQRASHLETVAH
jgi:hypothetical protein